MEHPEYPGYYDYANGWEKGGGSHLHDGGSGHFGDSKVLLHLPSNTSNFGPSRNIRIYPGRDYVLSAWVWVEIGELIIGGDYRHLESTSIPHRVSAKMKGFNGITVKPTGQWERVELHIPASEDLPESDWEDHQWCVRVYIGAPNNTWGRVDDIRFHPDDALMSTVYYDCEQRKPRLSVGPNGHPSHLVEYDIGGRRTASYKVDPEKQSDDDGYKTIAEKYEYGTVGDQLRLLFPTSGEKLNPGKEYSIKWYPDQGRPGNPANIAQSTYDIEWYDGFIWVTIAREVSGCSYNWTVPAGLTPRTGCKVRVKLHGDASVSDQSITPFTIQPNEAPSSFELVDPHKTVGPYATREELQDKGAPVTLAWTEATDPEDRVHYRVELRYAANSESEWQAVAQKAIGLAVDVTLADYGEYRWRVIASDGENETTSSEGSIAVGPKNFFLLRDVYGAYVAWVDARLYEELPKTLSAEKAEGFRNTYSLQVENKMVFPYKEFYPSMSWSGGNSFMYRVRIYNANGGDWGTSTSSWTAWEYEGEGCGERDQIGGGGCQFHSSATGLREIELRPTCGGIPGCCAQNGVDAYGFTLCCALNTDAESDNYGDVTTDCSSMGRKVNFPEISVSVDYACCGPNSTGSVDGTFPGSVKKSAHALMRMSCEISGPYHIWYRGWNRGNAGMSKWVHDGDYTGNGEHKMDMVWFAIYMY